MRRRLIFVIARLARSVDANSRRVAHFVRRHGGIVRSTRWMEEEGWKNPRPGVAEFCPGPLSGLSGMKSPGEIGSGPQGVIGDLSKSRRATLHHRLRVQGLASRKKSHVVLRHGREDNKYVRQRVLTNYRTYIAFCRATGSTL